MTYLLIEPNNFKVSYKINPWMESKNLNEKEVLREHDDLKRIINKFDKIIVNTINPSNGDEVPDIVFAANHAVVYKGKALLSKFRHKERQVEEPHILVGFQDLVWNGHLTAFKQFPSNINFEGAGDCLWDKKHQLFWMGYGWRTQYEAQRIVSNTFDVNVLALNLIDSYFYHLDLALCVLHNGEVMYYPGAFDSVSLNLIEMLVAPKDRIILTYKDAMTFAANSIYIETDVGSGDIIMPYGYSQELLKDLMDRGYNVRYIRLPNFQKSGGSVKCLTLDLDVGKS